MTPSMMHDARRASCDRQQTTGDKRQAGSWKTPVIGHSGGFRKTLSFGLTCLVYYATEIFCRRNFCLKNDPLGKTFGQMLGAARSAKQNIVEGSSRAGTSRETELRLYDVAKGSLEELAGDYEDFLFSRGELPWSEEDPMWIKTKNLTFDMFNVHEDLRHAFFKHLTAMRSRFAPIIENEDPVIAANALIVTIDRACSLLRRQMDMLGEEFRAQGGFTEHLTKVRLEHRDAAAVCADAPKCPDCGKPMRKVIARKGRNVGNAFWSCTGYPVCHGTRNIA